MKEKVDVQAHKDGSQTWSGEPAEELRPEPGTPAQGNQVEAHPQQLTDQCGGHIALEPHSGDAHGEGGESQFRRPGDEGVAGGGGLPPHPVEGTGQDGAVAGEGHRHRQWGQKGSGGGLPEEEDGQVWAQHR